MLTNMAENEQSRLILVGRDGVVVELTGTTNEGETLLDGVRTVLVAGRNSRLLTATPLDSTSLVQGEGPKKLPILPKYYPEIPLADELERQRFEATERIAVPLGIDRNLFQTSLPTRFPDRPAEYDNLRLSIPLIDCNPTIFGVTWLQMTEAALCYNPNNPETVLKAYIWDELRKISQKGELRVWQDPRENITPFPEVPHAVWIQDGTRHIGRKPIDVRRQLHQLERAGNHFKSTSQVVLRPDMVIKNPWDVIGGQVGVVNLPCVYWFGGPRFLFGRDGIAFPEYRAFVCGSEFTVA